MTEVEPGVYEITFNDIEYFDNYQVKFAANGSWAVNWGGTYQGSVLKQTLCSTQTATLLLMFLTILADVTIRLDISGFDYSTKQGAKFTVTVEEASAEQPTTEEPTEATTESTQATEETTEPTTAPSKGLELTATSNFLPSQTVKVDEGEEFVTVSYFMDSPKDILNAQLFMYYDPEVLEYKASYNASADGSYVDLMPVAGNNHISNSPTPGEVRIHSYFN